MKRRNNPVLLILFLFIPYQKFLDFLHFCLTSLLYNGISSVGEEWNQAVYIPFHHIFLLYKHSIQQAHIKSQSITVNQFNPEINNPLSTHKSNHYQAPMSYISHLPYSPDIILQTKSLAERNRSGISLIVEALIKLTIPP